MKRIRAGLRFALALSVVGSLAACSSTGDSSSVSSVSDKLLGRDKPDDIPQDYFTAKGYCPPIRLRSGTGVSTVYERGHDAEAAFVRYQASIGRTARECSPTADGLAIKVGIGGRVVGGPKGAAGNITLPVRVVVTRDNGDVAYSQLHKIGVALAAPDFAADFQNVVPSISVPMAPDERNVTIYVGFDEGKPG